MSDASSLAVLNRRVFRAAAVVWLIAWYIRAGQHVTWLFMKPAHAIEHALFPALMQWRGLSQLCYLAPVAAAVFIWQPSRRMLISSAGIMIAASGILLLHIDTYNDATYVTSFWVALWLLWLGVNVDRNDADVVLHGCVLAQCVLGMMFLGGAVGKLTSEYWSGLTVYEIYFQQKANWPYPSIRDNLDAETVRGIATWFSRVVLAVEAGLVLSPFLPTRWVCWIAPPVMLLIVVVSTWTLFSVMGSLIGMMLACLLWIHARAGRAALAAEPA